MTREDALTMVAEKYIPQGIHPLLRVDTRSAWIELATDLISGGHVAPSKENLYKLCKNWEALLIKKYSVLN